MFSSSTGTPLDMDVFRHRKLRKHLETLGIEQAGFHAFRHFNTALLDSIRTPLKIIQERMGHALTGSFTLDVYGHVLDWQGNVDAANKAGAMIEQAVDAEKLKNFVNVTAVENLTLSQSTIRHDCGRLRGRQGRPARYDFGQDEVDHGQS